MSSGERQQYRRGEREAAKEHQRASTATRMAERETLLEVADRLASDLKAPAGKIEPWEPVIVKRLRQYLRETGIVEPLEGLLRDHPGIPSPLAVEALPLAGLMSNWRRFSYLRSDGMTCLLRLPPDVKAELGVRTKEGTPEIKYRTYHKQVSRFEEKIIEQDASGEPYGKAWVEEQSMPPSVPEEFLATIEAASVDESSFKTRHKEECKAKQEDVDKKVREIFRSQHPNRKVPPMSSPEMIAIAAEHLGVPLGADGRIERTQKDKTVRKGHKTPTETDPSEFFNGWGVTSVIASGSFTLSRNSDKGTHEEGVRQYVLATTVNPANTNPGPVGCEVMERAMAIAPNIAHVYADQAYTQKEDSFLAPLRRQGIEPHMNMPVDAPQKPRPVHLMHKDGSTELVIEFCGGFFTQFTPKNKFKGPYEELAPYAWRLHERGDEGSKRLRCPFHLGHVYNRQFASYVNAKPGAEHVIVPKNAEQCCNGDVTVPAEKLGKFQVPPYGSQAHKDIMVARNTVEGGFGNVKDEGGFDPRLCRTRHTITHSLAAIYAQVARNLKMTLNDEIMQARAARKAKQTQKAETATRKAEQDPTDGSMRNEPESDDDESDASDDEEPSSGDEAPSRAPP